VLGSPAESSGELSELQRRMLGATVRGKNDAAIATELGITENEVEAQLHRAYRILGVDNRIDAVYELAKRGERLA